MKRIPATIQLIVTACIVIIFSSSVVAGEKPKHVVELFTSQSCYSCPPAEQLLGEISIDRKDILALEFHVDYWNNLVYGSAGQWQDPYSSKEFSQRQRDYNRLRLKGRKGVYTPQMIVDGQYAFVGSNKRQAKKQMNSESNLVLDVNAEITNNGGVSIEVMGDFKGSADIYLVTFDVKQVTEIPAGENMGKTLENFNIVRNMESVGKWKGKPVTIVANNASPAQNQGCAVIVQKYDRSKRVAGPVVGAAQCTAS